MTSFSEDYACMSPLSLSLSPSLKSFLSFISFYSFLILVSFVFHESRVKYSLSISYNDTKRWMWQIPKPLGQNTLCILLHISYFFDTSSALWLTWLHYVNRQIYVIICFVIKTGNIIFRQAYTSLRNTGLEVPRFEWGKLKREDNIERYLQEMVQSIWIQIKYLRAECKCRAVVKTIMECRVSLKVRDFLVVSWKLTSNKDIATDISWQTRIYAHVIIPH